MKKVLIIDDDPDLLDVMKDALESAGYLAYTANNPDNIFELLDQHEPGLLLVDFILNGVNGGEICHMVKTAQRRQQLPVIIVSAYSRVFLSLGNYGCDALIAKPFDLQHLISTVEKYLPGELAVS